MSILVFLALLSLFLGSIFVVRGAGEASSSVSDAYSAVRVAFNATLEAERAGANVSDLIARLNEAAGLLDEAEVALNSGNSSDAAIIAGQCIGIAESVQSDADALKASALDQARTVFWTYLTFSVVSSAAFVVVLAVVWQRFKCGYFRKMLGMKLEVAHDEA
jgi:hypothetical protein